MRIGALQWSVLKNEKKRNLAIIEKHLTGSGADLVVLPELFSTGYYFDNAEEMDALAETVPEGLTTQGLLRIARKEGCTLVGAIMEKDQDKYYITAVAAGPDGFLGKHRKRHLTTHESALFTPGDQSEVFDIGGCLIGSVICFEGWFPESSRDLMLQGAQIICHSLLTTQERTLDMMRIRALENKAFMVVANSTATESFQGCQTTFRGDSRVIDHHGNILINAGRSEGLFTVDIDPEETRIKDLEDCSDLITEALKHR